MESVSVCFVSGSGFHLGGINNASRASLPGSSSVPSKGANFPSDSSAGSPLYLSPDGPSNSGVGSAGVPLCELQARFSFSSLS